MLNGYNALKKWMAEHYYDTDKMITITTPDGETYTGLMYGDDECFDVNEFYQYMLTDDALLKAYYHIEGVTDYSNIDYDHPYKVADANAKYWIDYVI